MGSKQKTFPIPNEYLSRWWDNDQINSFQEYINKLSKLYAKGQKLKYKIKQVKIKNPKTKKVVRVEAHLTIKWKEK